MISLLLLYARMFLEYVDIRIPYFIYTFAETKMQISASYIYTDLEKYRPLSETNMKTNHSLRMNKKIKLSVYIRKLIYGILRTVNPIMYRHGLVWCIYFNVFSVCMLYIYSYSSGLLYSHYTNGMIYTLPVRSHWCIWAYLHRYFYLLHTSYNMSDITVWGIFRAVSVNH